MSISVNSSKKSLLEYSGLKQEYISLKSEKLSCLISEDNSKEEL